MINKYLYYLLIAVLTVITLAFFPLLGSGVSLSLLFPTTTAGWVVWGIQKGSAVLFNCMVFHCFIKQSRLNIADNPRYREARDILVETEEKEEIPQSPAEYFRQVYTKKGFTLVLTTLLGLIGFGSAVLVWNMTLFIAQLITTGIACGFGILQMKEAEDYWTETYYQYAKYIKKTKGDKKCLNTTTNNTEASKSK